MWGWRDGLAIKSMGFFSSGAELTPCIYMRQLTTTPTAVPGSPWLPRAPALRRQQEMGLFASQGSTDGSYLRYTAYEREHKAVRRDGHLNT